MSKPQFVLSIQPFVVIYKNVSLSGLRTD